MSRVPVVLLVLSLVLAACGGSGDNGTTAPRTGGAAVPAIDYTRADSSSGSTLRLVIDASGNAKLDDYAFTLSDDERAQLAAAARGVDFKGNAGHDRGGRDPASYVYGLRVGDTPVLDNDTVIPTPVSGVVAVLERIATNHSPERRKLEAEAKDQLIVMVRDGGVAAQHIVLKIADDGRASAAFGNPPGTAPDVRRFTISPEQLMAVKRALAGGPDALRSKQDPNVVVADGYTYVLITGGQTITAAEPVDNPQLDELLQALQQVLETAR